MKKPRSPVDYTAEQMQNLIALAGVCIAMFFSIASVFTGREPPSLLVTLTSIMMVGQRAIPLGRRNGNGSDESINAPKDQNVVERTSRRPRTKKPVDNDSDSNYRNLCSFIMGQCRRITS